MRVCNVIKVLVLLIFLIFAGSSCAPIDSFFSSIGNYRINVKVNNHTLNDFSFIRTGDIIRPFFEGSVLDDPDLTGLEVFLRDNSRGRAIVSWRVVYELDRDLTNNEDNDNNNDNVNADSSRADSGGDSDSGAASDNNDDGGSANDGMADSDNADSGNIDNGETESDELLTENEISETPEIELSQADLYVQELADSQGRAALSTPGNVLNIPVGSLNDLPIFPMPENLPKGRHIFVFHVLSGDNVLQRIEIPFYYLGDAAFSYNDINVHLPGIAENTQLIPRGTVIMLEADVDFGDTLDPYVQWFLGRRQISSGKFSEGAGQLFWTVPEESGFFSFHAIVFPIEDFQGLTGLSRDISLLVTSNIIDLHLFYQDMQGLLYWYVFEGSLDDSRLISSSEETAAFHENNSPKWKGFNGTYGVTAGFNNNIRLPRILFADYENEAWQLKFRLKHQNDGGFLSVLFDDKASMHLYADGTNLILTLTSQTNTVSQRFPLLTPGSVVSNFDFESFDIFDAAEQIMFELTEFEQNIFDQTWFELPEIEPADSTRLWADIDSFLTIAIDFEIQSNVLSANLNVLGDFINYELAAASIAIETETVNGFQVILGYLRNNIRPAYSPAAAGFEDTRNRVVAVRHEVTALWDEFALFNMPVPEDNQSIETALGD